MKLSELNRRRLANFRANRRGFWSLWIFLALFGLSLASELVANDQPILVRYDGQLFVPFAKSYPETAFGGEFETRADYRDPAVEALIEAKGWILWPPIRFSYRTVNLELPVPAPAPPSADNWLGTDDRGRDVLAQLIYGFRVSVLFALALTVTGVVLGVLTGAIQGFFWRACGLGVPALHRSVGLDARAVFAHHFFCRVRAQCGAALDLAEPVWLDGLIGLCARRVLAQHQMDYVRAARAMGLTSWQIMWRHVLPNSLTPVVTFLPFRMSAAILALTSLDFLGLGVPPGTPSLGELLSQGKNNIDAWWISLSTFGVLVVTLMLLTFMGDALRDALDPRKASVDGGKA
jgi:microcin C transport system permease protein